MTLVAAGLLVLAGYGVLRLLAGGSPLRDYGPLASAGLSILLGATAIGLATTYAAVLGLSTRPWPIVAPIAILLAAISVLPARAYARVRLPGQRSESRRAMPRTVLWGDCAVGATVVALGVTLLVGGNGLTVYSNDEYAIWAIRGRTLSLAGHLDPAVFQGAAAQYQHLDYPLLVPSLIAWGDGISGRADDTSAHILLMLLTLGMAAVVGWAANRLAGPLAGVCAVLLVVGTPRLLAPFGLRLMADIPLAAFAVSAIVLLAVWVTQANIGMLAIATGLAAGAAAVKVEGAVFALAGLSAALIVAPSVERARKRAAAAIAAVITSMVPWILWERLHGIESDLINGQTISASHLRAVVRSSGLVVHEMVHYWPGYGWLGVVGALVALTLAMTMPRLRPLAAFLCLAWFIATLGIWAQYVISSGRHQTTASVADELRAHFASSATRVLLVPAIVASLAMPVLAGACLTRRSHGPPTDRAVHRRPEQTHDPEHRASAASE